MSNHQLQKRGLALSVHARVRAAGMASLLQEVLASNAARDLGDDLKDRIQIAIQDQEEVTEQSTTRRCKHCNCVLAYVVGGLEHHAADCPNLPF